MKSVKTLIAVTCAMALLSGVTIARAAEDKHKDCCEANVEAEKNCSHECCKKAGEAGKICKKCHPAKKKTTDEAK